MAGVVVVAGVVVEAAAVVVTVGALPLTTGLGALGGVLFVGVALSMAFWRPEG